MIRRHPLIGSAGSKYGLVYTDNNAVFLERQTANGAITDSKKLKINIKELKGKSLVWSQLAPLPTTRTDPYYTITRESGYNRLVTTGGNTSPFGVGNITFTNCVAGHKYYFTPNTNENGSATTFDIIYYLGMETAAATTNKKGVIAIGGSANAWTCYIRVKPGAIIDITFNYQLIDLTLLGIDNVTTVEEVEAWLANNIGNLPYFAFNPGTILNNKFNIFESVEFNQWDEEWELGTLDSQGRNIYSYNRIRTKNYIPILGSVTYYCKMGTIIGTLGTVAFYDAKKQFLSLKYPAVGNIIPPANSAFMRIAFYVSYGIIYNHDICINLSNPIHNGQYKPYKSHIINLNLTTITGKVNGEGQSVIICPNGLMSAGTAYDEGIIENGYLTKIIKRIGVMDLGTPNWTYNPVSERYPYGYFSALRPLDMKSNDSASVAANAITPKYIVVPSNIVALQGYDKAFASTSGYIFIANSAYTNAATFKIAMNDVKLNYELATPIIYVLDNPIYVGTFGHSYGVERILPQNTEDPYTIPANMVIDYLAKN